jgi:Domain of unknown function (DUF4407)/TIR domain
MAAQLLIVLSGADSENLADHPTERLRFLAIGCAVVTSFCLASVSMWFLLTADWNLNAAVVLLLSLLGGYVVAGVYRWLAVTAPPRSTAVVFAGVPRLVLALALGGAVAVPVVLQTFQAQVDAQISVVRQEKVQSFLSVQQSIDKTISSSRDTITSLNEAISSHGVSANPENSEVSTLKVELTAATNAKNQLYNDYICQRYGGANCPKAGDGPAEQADYASYQNESSKVSTYQKQLTFLEPKLTQENETAYEHAMAVLPSAQKSLITNESLAAKLQGAIGAAEEADHGVGTEWQALNQAAAKSPAVNATRILLLLVFLALAMLPLLLRLVQVPEIHQPSIRKQPADGLDAGAASDRPERVPRPADAAAKSRRRSRRPVRQGRLIVPSAQAGNHVFISYAHEDSPKVDKLQDMLEKAGVSVWRDTEQLWPGQNWRAVIEHAIKNDALVFLACFSSTSLAREKSYQNQELVLAIEQMRELRPDVSWLIPVRLDDCEIPDISFGDGRTLKSIQHGDFFGPRENGQRLLASVLQILGDE